MGQNGFSQQIHPESGRLLDYFFSLNGLYKCLCDNVWLITSAAYF